MRTLIISIALLASIANAAAQGCSDAGFCTMGAMKHEITPDSITTKHKITLSWANGLGDDGVFVSTPGLAYEMHSKRNYTIQVKATGNYASGNLGNALGAGDLYANVTKSVKAAKDWRISFTAGFRIPLSAGDLKYNYQPLPMQYQSSLGTYDAIGGITLTRKKWQFSAGYQQPLSDHNKNGFLYSAWPGTDTKAYPQSNNFRRHGDALLKAGYAFEAGKKWTLLPGLLAVYHLGEDSYFDPATMRELSLKGSDGLTLNATLNVQYRANKWSFGMILGRPLVVRDIRPDGLTRSIVAAPEFSFNF